jgi:hypothetical protein
MNEFNGPPWPRSDRVCFVTDTHVMVRLSRLDARVIGYFLQRAAAEGIAIGAGAPERLHEAVFHEVEREHPDGTTVDFLEYVQDLAVDWNAWTKES